MKAIVGYIILITLLLIAATTAYGAPATVAPPGESPAAVAPSSHIPTTRPALGASSTRLERLPVDMMPVANPNVKKAPKPNVATDQATCATAECHAEVKNYKVVHGPVNVNSCDACHKLVDEKQHRFEPRRNKQELCTFCHEVKSQDMPILHQPVKDGDCMGCHNPHGGETRRFTHGKTMAELCNRCHENVLAGKKMIHGPAASGTCDSCHTSHGSKFPKLVNSKGSDLCYDCHDTMKAQMAQVKFTHKAVTDKGCLDCHDAHASNHANHIKQEPLQLCTSCHEHEKVKLAVDSAKHKHSIVTKDQACLNCHTAHGGDLAKLMKDQPVNVCMKCHDKPQKDSGGRIIAAAVPEVLEPDKIKHGPIRDGNCGGCHNVHGSDQESLLAKQYSTDFYQKYAPEKYDLCFSCHEKTLVQSAKAKGLTGFRNGDANLHFAHVAKTEKGRNCRSCHQTHASNHELHVRETVTYGKWEMPINFKKTDTGGSCSPGCHKPYEYDRDKPVQYMPAAAGASPVAAGTEPKKLSDVIVPPPNPLAKPQPGAAAVVKDEPKKVARP
jgi:predicted CXXCH cytochrome family protein